MNVKLIHNEVYSLGLLPAIGIIFYIYNKRFYGIQFSILTLHLKITW